MSTTSSPALVRSAATQLPLAPVPRTAIFLVMVFPRRGRGAGRVHLLFSSLLPRRHCPRKRAIQYSVPPRFGAVGLIETVVCTGLPACAGNDAGGFTRASDCTA